VEGGYVVFTGTPAYVSSNGLWFHGDDDQRTFVGTCNPSFAFVSLAWALGAEDVRGGASDGMRIIFHIGPMVGGFAYAKTEGAALRLRLQHPTRDFMPDTLHAPVVVRFTPQQRRAAAAKLEPLAIPFLLWQLTKGGAKHPNGLVRPLVERINDDRVTEAVRRLKADWDEDTRAWADQLLETRAGRASRPMNEEP
jgi:hypothetical protein